MKRYKSAGLAAIILAGCETQGNFSEKAEPQMQPLKFPPAQIHEFSQVKIQECLPLKIYGSGRGYKGSGKYDGKEKLSDEGFYVTNFEGCHPGLRHVDVVLDGMTCYLWTFKSNNYVSATGERSWDGNKIQLREYRTRTGAFEGLGINIEYSDSYSPRETKIRVNDLEGNPAELVRIHRKE